jgi:hypothetical protein
MHGRRGQVAEYLEAFRKSIVPEENTTKYTSGPNVWGKPLIA